MMYNKTYYGDRGQYARYNAVLGFNKNITYFTYVIT